MIPAQFDYVAPTSLAEAVTALGEAGEDAKILAGGQSLIPVLRLRLAFPTVLVDLGKVDELRGVRDDGDALLIGAMTRHSDVLEDPLVRQYAGLLAEATATVADPAVRHRGTFGGALAHADPAGDLAAVALALDAELVAEGPGGGAASRLASSSWTTWRPRCRRTRSWRRSGCPSSRAPGATATRSSTGWPRPGRSSASRPPCGWTAGRWPRRASA
jgi:CO/xanthine dehydrogenase FAD-binding subunit